LLLRRVQENPERFLRLGPHAVVVFYAGDVADEHREFLAGIIELRCVRRLRGRLGTPLGIGQAKLDPALSGGGSSIAAAF